MSTTLILKFPLGRVHATPWGRHVNEGLVELPPAPWRLLRAMYSVWQLRLPDLDAGTVTALLGRLAEPPVYFVPPFQLSHTRHYYPDSVHRTSAASTDRTLDAFAVVDPASELGVQWPFDLAREEQRTLARLAASLPYLGRADSICEARLGIDWSPTLQQRVAPLDVDERAAGSMDTIDLLAPELPLDVARLVARPLDIRAKRLLYPPGSRSVPYEKPIAARPRPVRRRRAPEQTTAVRFTATAPALPPHTDALYLTSRLRRAAMKKLGDIRAGEQAHGALAGRSPDGELLRGHCHAHYLALPSNDRRIEELAVWVPDGLGEDELLALSRITRLWGHEREPGPGAVEVRMSGYGDPETVLPELRERALVWESVTPFLPPRHRKRRSVDDFVADEVEREANYRAIPGLTSVEIVDTDDWRMFARRRPHEPAAVARAEPRIPVGLRLRFAEPVHGPLALGSLSHFGMGLFRPRG